MSAKLTKCQDRLKTWLIVQHGLSEIVLMKTPVFLHCLKLSGSFDCVGVLYSSICVDVNLQKFLDMLMKHQTSYNAFSLPMQTHLSLPVSIANKVKANLAYLYWRLSLTMNILCFYQKLLTEVDTN